MLGTMSCLHCNLLKDGKVCAASVHLFEIFYVLSHQCDFSRFFGVMEIWGVQKFKNSGLKSLVFCYLVVIQTLYRF